MASRADSSSRMRIIVIALSALAALLALPSCSDDDVKWEIGREAEGGIEHDREQIGEEWRLYRDNVVRSLDLMTHALENVAGAGSVVDRKEIDRLVARVEELRSGMASEVEDGRKPQTELTATRVRLREGFERIRTDVDALLTRLGHDPDAIARWQDKR